MILDREESIRHRVTLLRAEVAEIHRSNEEYSQVRHTISAQQVHVQRRGRLEEIVAELKGLCDRTIQ